MRRFLEPRTAKHELSNEKCPREDREGRFAKLRQFALRHRDTLKLEGLRARNVQVGVGLGVATWIVAPSRFSDGRRGAGPGSGRAHCGQPQVFRVI